MMLISLVNDSNSLTGIEFFNNLASQAGAPRPGGAVAAAVVAGNTRAHRAEVRDLLKSLG